jgi:pimeloyl-ACP methyl ester carboxylesterase
MRETASVLKRISYYRAKYDLEGAQAFSVPGRSIDLLTTDGIRIFGTELGNVGTAHDRGWIFVHGLLAHHRAPGPKEFAESLTRYGPVWAIDLRGHGLSSGKCTLGNLEALDVAAAVGHARNQTDRPLILVGFSMGAAACIRAAALYAEVDAVVAVSGPAEWHGTRRWAAHVTRAIWKTPGGTTLLRHLTGVRIRAGWLESESPVSVIGKIAPAPVLVVHGTADQFFPLDEAQLLFENAQEPKDLWMVKGGGHAEGFFMEPARPVLGGRVNDFVDVLVTRICRLMRRTDAWPG